MEHWQQKDTKYSNPERFGGRNVRKSGRVETIDYDKYGRIKPAQEIDW